ncbi:MAG: 2-hydroxyacid dehydrogenase [Thermoleophilaceae bacterium]
MSRCFVSRALPEELLAPLVAEHDVDMWPEETTPPPHEELVARCSEAEGLLSMLSDRIDAGFIAACPRLRAISNYAVGVDNVDLEAATARGIPVGHTPDVLTDTTADVAFALMLAAARRVVESDALVRAGRWPAWEPFGFLGHDVHHTTLGIVGFGRIGRAVARRAAGFGMDVLHTRDVSLDELLERSDFVSLHVPLSGSTRGLIGERELLKMKPTAILVNTARGPIVDTAALERALKQGWIAAAGLDVTDPEPLPPDHPLLTAPNLTVLPHIGSATRRTREAMAKLAVENLLRGLRGERMPKCANPSVYESPTRRAP